MKYLKIDNRRFMQLICPTVLVAGALLLLQSCGKEFLDKKNDKSLLVPTTFADFQSLMDNTSIMNALPGLTLLATDDYYTNDAGFKTYVEARDRNSYIWAADIYEGGVNTDWNRPYQQVFYSNIVLEGLDKIVTNESNRKEWNSLKGSALFYRSFAFYNLLQVFAEPYRKGGNNDDAGIPLHLKSDVNIRPGRGTVQEGYRQVLQDLQQAAELLPDRQSVKSRPGKVAAYALLAKTYLLMGDYEQAAGYATKGLGIQAELIEFRTLNKTSAAPFPISLPNGNPEVIFHSAPIVYRFVSNTTYATPELYAAYDQNDLRKTLFFDKRATDLYTGWKNFTGITTSELYLIRSECEVRFGQIDLALKDLNTLLSTRWELNSFTPVMLDNPDALLKKVLLERRKEMIYRGSRWEDLRRFNQEPLLAVTLSRTVNGETYTLAPNSKRYVYPLPDSETTLGGLEQNAR
jgi:tetratricopeptide (TPR) repeat protein